MKVSLRFSRKGAAVRAGLSLGWCLGSALSAALFPVARDPGIFNSGMAFVFFALYLGWWFFGGDE